MKAHPKVARIVKYSVQEHKAYYSIRYDCEKRIYRLSADELEIALKLHPNMKLLYEIKRTYLGQKPANHCTA